MNKGLLKKCQKWSNLASLRQTELPDRSVLIGQKLVENAKIEKFKCDIFCNFQTLCTTQKLCLKYTSDSKFRKNPMICCENPNAIHQKLDFDFRQ